MSTRSALSARFPSLTPHATDALKVIPGEGMPSQRHHEPGDLFVRVTVRFPDSIPPESIPLLEQALPPRKPLEKFPKGTVLEEVEAAEADARQAEYAEHGEAMDEDEDGEGEPRVQCANQ